LQPDIIVNSRVGRAGGSYGLERESGMLGDYATPEQVIPDRVIADQPWETCMTMNGNWGYNAADNNFKSTTDLIRKLAEIAGKGGNFLLNVGPDAKGEIPAQSLAHLKEIGTWMRTHSDSIKGTIAGPFDKTPWGSCTQKKLANGDTRLFLHVFDWPTDGRLTIPGLLSEPRAASLLGAPANTRVTASRRDDAVILTLPPAAERNPHDNVIVLDVAGEANVAVAPTITAFSDIFLESTPVAFSTPQKGVQLRYTTDGSDPVATSPLANQVVLTGQGEGSQVKVRGFLNGKAVSPVATRKFEVANLWPARKTRDGIPDIVTYEYYEGAFKSVADFDKASPVKTGDTPGFDLSVRQKESNWGIKYHATIQVPKDGVYRFFLSSDDGSTLQVDGKMVVNNDKDHSYKTEKGDAPLAAGLHDIELRMYENSGGFALKLEWESPDAGLKRQEVRPLTQ